MTITVSLGITAYNEEKAMPFLLRSLEVQKIPNKFELAEIIIVSSGSTDNTNQIVKSFQEKDSRIRLIIEPEKRGKAAALNQIIKSYVGDILIQSVSDGFYSVNCIYNLLRHFTDSQTSAVSCHPKPVNPKNTMWGYASHLLWDMHHMMCSYFPAKLSGELFATRREYICRVPEKRLFAEDIFIERNILKKNGKIVYEPRAIFRMMGPQTALDYFRQRRRVVGHLRKAEIATSIKIPTTNYMQILRVFLRYIRSFLSLYTLPVITVELLARVIALNDVRVGNVTNNWKMVNSTKFK